MDQEISKLQQYSDKFQKQAMQRNYKKKKCKSKAHLFSKSDIFLFISFIIMSYLRNSRRKTHVLYKRKTRSCSICDSIGSSFCLFAPWSLVAVALKRKSANSAEFKLLYTSILHQCLFINDKI